MDLIRLYQESFAFGLANSSLEQHETSKSLGESISVRDSCPVALQTKQTGFEKYKAFNDRTIDYDKLELQAVATTDDSPAILEHTIVETPMNMSPENKAHFEAKKEAIHLILTGIGDEIYLTVDACQTTQEMWEAIERSHTTTRHKGKEIAKPIKPPSETAFEEDSDPEQAKRDKNMQKNLALIANNTFLVETDDSNVIPDSPDMCEDDIQNDQNDVESDDERVTLANLIANLKLDVDENKKIQKQLKKANITLAQELNECKTILVETINALGESISVWDSCLVALQNKQTEFEKYKAFNDHTIDYDKLEHKLNEALGQLA
nr:hypothetical protein [Tanacetum cinerariifolium]